MALARDDRAIGNRLLGAMPQRVLERLRLRLERTDLVLRQRVHSVNAPITHLYFVEQGLVSLVKTMHDGCTVEIGAVGVEGVVGWSALLGIKEAALDALVQIPGTALRLDCDVLDKEMGRSEGLRQFMWRYAHFAVSQPAQAAACNRLHTLEERCCRWLLMAHDGALSDTFPLTHEFLALMLGVRRPGLSATAGMLQEAGVISYSRGRVSVIDRAGLEAAACECYATMRSQLADLFAAAVVSETGQTSMPPRWS